MNPEFRVRLASQLDCERGGKGGESRVQSSGWSSWTEEEKKWVGEFTFRLSRRGSQRVNESRVQRGLSSVGKWETPLLSVPVRASARQSLAMPVTMVDASRNAGSIACVLCRVCQRSAANADASAANADADADADVTLPVPVPVPLLSPLSPHSSLLTLLSSPHSLSFISSFFSLNCTCSRSRALLFSGTLCGQPLLSARVFCAHDRS